MQIGYARVSTTDQTTAPQEDQLRAAGCERVYSDVMSGSKAKRPGLDEVLTQARKGDVVTVVRLDRLGRSLVDLVATVRQLKGAGVGFRSLSEQIDTTSAGGKLIFHIFGSLAEFERTLIQERTNAGLSSARARGRIGGRPRDTDTRRQAMAAALLSDPANGIADVCRILRVSKATAYRLAAKGRELHQPLAAAKRKERAKTEHDVPAQTARRPAAVSGKEVATSSPTKAKTPTRTKSKAKIPTAARKTTKTTQKRQ